MICPNCKSEIQQNEDNCSFCGYALNGYKFIKGCSNEFERDIVLGLLKSCEIDVVTCYNPSGLEAILYNPRGNNGLDIYVREDCFEEALAILNCENTIEEFEN